MALRRAFLGLAALAAPACRSHPPSYGLAPSLLPNLGLAASVAVPLRPASAWQLEARFTDQFIDDKTFADNGLEEAGNWTQLDLGLLYSTPWTDGRAWTVRAGVVGFEARGDPNLVELPGDYLGGYVGVGRFALLGAELAFGPEVTLVAASGPDPRVLIPQITWGIRWMPGRRRGGDAR